MAKQQRTASQQLREEAQKHLDMASAFNAQATVLETIASDEGVSGLLDAIDRHQTRLEKLLRAAPSPETRAEIVETLSGLHEVAKNLASVTKRTITKLAKTGSASSGANRKTGGGRTTVPPPPEDLSVLEDLDEALEAYIVASGHASSTAYHDRAALRALIAAAEERGVPPLELDPRDVMPAKQASVCARIVRWILESRDSAEGGTASEVDGGEAAGDGVDPGSVAPIPPANNGLAESLAQIAEDVNRAAVLRVAALAAAAGLSPRDTEMLTHDGVIVDDGVATITLDGADGADGARSFEINADLYQQLQDQTGQAEGPLMIYNARQLTEEEIGRMVSLAVEQAPSSS